MQWSEACPYGQFGVTKERFLPAPHFDQSRIQCGLRRDGRNRPFNVFCCDITYPSLVKALFTQIP
jgi:hypothetical protein